MEGGIRSCLITIGSSVGLQNVPHRSLPLLISSFSLLSLLFLFIFTVEYTWCCLGIAWVGIDFSFLCSVGGCLAQEFRDTQGFVVAFVSFSTSLLWSSRSIHHKNAPPLCAAHLTGCPLYASLTGVTVWSPQGPQDFPPEQQGTLKSQQSLWMVKKNPTDWLQRALEIHVKQFENAEIQ